jgi:hypothetical protein
MSVSRMILSSYENVGQGRSSGFRELCGHGLLRVVFSMLQRCIGVVVVCGVDVVRLAVKRFCPVGALPSSTELTSPPPPHGPPVDALFLPDYGFLITTIATSISTGFLSINPARSFPEAMLTPGNALYYYFFAGHGYPSTQPNEFLILRCPPVSQQGLSSRREMTQRCMTKVPC